MEEENPRRNLLAIAVMALVVTYVGSYLLIRVNSSYVGPDADSGGYMVFAVSESELPLVLASPKAPEARKIIKRAEFMNRIFHPLRKVDWRISNMVDSVPR